MNNLKSKLNNQNYRNQMYKINMINKNNNFNSYKILWNNKHQMFKY